MDSEEQEGEDFVPIAISGNDVYLTWWTNKSGNNEVMFRASTDGGQTFGDKLNLSNSTGAESQDTEIAAEGGNVICSFFVCYNRTYCFFFTDSVRFRDSRSYKK